MSPLRQVTLVALVNDPGPSTTQWEKWVPHRIIEFKLYMYVACKVLDTVTGTQETTQSKITLAIITITIVITTIVIIIKVEKDQNSFTLLFCSQPVFFLSVQPAFIECLLWALNYVSDVNMNQVNSLFSRSSLLSTGRQIDLHSAQIRL